MTWDKSYRDTICQRIAEGESLRSVCRDENMPGLRTVLEWLEAEEEFRVKYARAREIQADLMAAELIDIADDGTNDWMEKKNASGENLGWAENGEALKRSQIRIATRQWIASKLLPKKYGEKLAVGGANDLPPIDSKTTVVLTAEEAYKRMLGGG